MKRRLLLGLDVGSSSVKAGLVDADSREAVATGFFPHQEAPVKALRIGMGHEILQLRLQIVEARL